MVQVKKIICLFVLWVISFSYSIAQTVLIDPGHGGSDLGAKRYVHYKKKKTLVSEKTLTLSLAQALQKELSKHVACYLTRGLDRSVGLAERAELADKLKADLFISIHANSSLNKKAQGIETFYLSNHKNEGIKKIESVENRGITGENALINSLLADLVVTKLSPKSKKLANQVQRHLVRNLRGPLHMVNRGVRPGVFYVLALTKRPAILIEAGFLSHGEDLKKMQSTKFHKVFAQSVTQGILAYLKKQK